MARKAVHLTPRQEEIKRLLDAQPDLPVAQIAEALETSEGAIYQQITRMRKAGALPKRRRQTPGPPPGPVGRHPLSEPAPEPAPVASNGDLSVEQHVAEELQSTLIRIKEVKGQREALAAEEEGLTERQKRLDAASKALVA